MKEVGIAEFKAHLSKYLRQAKLGQVITITDRGAPVAQLGQAPARNGLRPQPAKSKLRDFEQLPPLELGGIDIVDLLLETRQNQR
ncbi:MAG TPA: type II toxin-antitoxin system prevent-host-death family antitoxin [Terriglobales bacterium]|nr:type II toxin-antitoxin system prevent-host-death family antitoxin [Terriglobales bacterium]